MSRFFATGSESESESSSSDEEVVLQKAPGMQSKAFQFSDDEEDTKRVVRSARDKRFDELTEIIRKIKNHKKIKDMGKVLQGLENMIKAYQKAKQIVDKEGIPRFYIRCLVEMEDFVNEVWEDREGRKTMSKNNSKGLSTLRQKLRKYDRDFEKEITDYRENPDVGDEEEEDDEGSDSDNEGNTLGTDFFSAGKVDIGMQDAKSKVVKGDDEESEDDETDWGESSEDESSSSSDDEKYAGNLAAKFLKKAGTKEEEETVKKEKKKKDKEKRVHKREDKDDDDGGGEWEEVKGGIPLMTERPKMFAKDAEINHDVVLKKLNEILAARGKKSTDRTEQIELLIELRAVSEAHNLGPAMSIKIMFSVTSAIYDYNPNVATCMKLDMWQKCLSHISELLQILDTYPDITVGEHISDESENYENPDSPYRLRGCILTLVERMDEEFTKMLQNCDAHSTEYVERLKDEKLVCDIIEHLQAYLEKKGNTSELCRIYLRRIEHMYFKVQQLGQEDSTHQMDRLCKYIYAKDNTDRIRTRAILCHIYHHALHDRWFEARDLMLMSHLQDAIHLADVPLQILYNRTMVQLGLCAFRHGMIKDSHHALLDIQSGGRAKELLAQGLLMQRQHERNPEQEKIEKRRQMPFHMHINLEQLECVYLVSAMLLEIPYMAAHEFDTRRRMISKSFHHLLKISERQPLVGPPESMREHIVAASKAMKIGDWKACKNYIINEKMNTKVWNLFHKPDKVLNMLVGKIQEESLRTYLFTYSSVYDSISLDILSEMFELEKAIVHGIISKMIINEELMASLDEPTQTVVMHRTEPSRLQSLALQLADKVTTVVENNEKILDLKQGSFFNRTPGQQNINYQRQGGYQSGRGYGQQQDWGQQNSNYQRQGGYQSGRGYGQQQDWGQQNSNYQRQGGYQSGRGYGQQDWGQSNYQRQGGYQSGRGYGNKDWGQSNYQRQGGYQSGRGFGNKEWGKRGQSQRAF